MIMNVGLKQKILIDNIGIAAALFIIAGIIIYPTVKNILELRGEINIIQQQTEERYEKIQKLKRSLKELAQIKSTTGEMEKTMARPGDELLIITAMEKLAASHQIDQTLNLNFIDEQKQKTNIQQARALPQYYRLSFLNNGLFNNHLAYFSALQKLPYYVIIENVNLEKRNQGADKTANPVILRFDAIIYVKPD